MFCRDLGAIEGGKYLFKTLNDCGKLARESFAPYKAVFDEHGSFRYDYEHPTSRDRLHNIELYENLPDEMIEQEQKRLKVEMFEAHHPL